MKVMMMNQWRWWWSKWARSPRCTRIPGGFQPEGRPWYHIKILVLCTDVDPQTSDIGVVPSENGLRWWFRIQNDLVVGLLGTPKDAQMLEDLRQDQATDRIPAAANPCCCTALEPTQRMDIEGLVVISAASLESWITMFWQRIEHQYLL